MTYPTLSKVTKRLLAAVLAALTLVSSLVGVQAAVASTNVSVLQSPTVIALDNQENSYVANSVDNVISKMSSQGTVSMLATLPSKALALAVDSSGTLYAATVFGNVYKISQEGVITLFAKVGRGPVALVFDKLGNLYSADSLFDTVSKVTPQGVVSTFAQVGIYPVALTFDIDGNLFTADYSDNSVTRITPAGVTSTFAQLSVSPTSISSDLQGNIYVLNSQDKTITKISKSGAISFFAGVGNDPRSLVSDSNGNLYAANYGDGTISKISSAGLVSTFQVTGQGPIALAINSSSTLASANYLDSSITTSKVNPTRATAPTNLASTKTLASGVDLVWEHLATSETSGYFIQATADAGKRISQTVRTNSPLKSFTFEGLCAKGTYQISVAGIDSSGLGLFSTQVSVTIPNGAPSAPLNPEVTGVSGTSVDLIWDAPSCDGGVSITNYNISFSSDAGISWTQVTKSSSTATSYKVNSLIIGRNYSFRIQAVNSLGVSSTSVPTYATTASPVTSYSVGPSPTQMAFDSQGTLYVSNSTDFSISKITNKGVLSKIVGLGEGPGKIVVDKSDNLFVANSLDGTISKVTPAGVVSLFASPEEGLQDIVIDSVGNLFATNSVKKTILKVTSAGVMSVFATLPNSPFDIQLDSQGNLYTANGLSNSIFKINPLGQVSEFASLSIPAKRLVIDAQGNFYGFSSSSNLILKISSTGFVSTFATLSSPIADLTIDKAGNLYIADSSDSTVYKLGNAGSLSSLAYFADTISRIAVDGNGNLFSSFWENKVYKTYLAQTPSAVQSLSSSQLGSNSVTLNWVAPLSDGGSAVSGYRVESSLDAGLTWVSLGSSSVTSFSVSNLFNKKSYLFRVFALNGLGSGLSSNQVSLTTAAISSSAPRDLRVVSASSSSLTLGWLLPLNDGGEAVTSYRLEVSADSGLSWVFVSRPASLDTAVVVSDLVPNKTYRFRVFAETAFGLGQVSSVLSATTSTTTPSAVQSLSSSQLGSNSVTLNWVAPLSDGGSAVSGYRVESSLDAGQSWQVVAVNPASTASFPVTGLTAKKNYSFRVFAINTLGQGPSSNQVNLITLARVATEPREPVTSALTQSDISIGWSAPLTDGGDVITNYQLAMSLDLGTTWVFVARPISTALSATISDLSPGNTYKFKIYAVNSLGSSQASTVFSATTLFALPDSPLSSSFTKVGTVSAAMSWTAVLANPKVTNYLVDISSDGISWVPVVKKVSPMTNLFLSKLQPGTEYKLRIAAVNSTGIGNYSHSSFTTLSQVPSTPSGLTATNLSAAQLALAWAIPVSHGGSAIADYTVEIKGGGFVWAQVAHQPGPQNSITITGLKPATKYILRVKALNSVGYSKVSTSLGVTTQPTVPDAPTALLLKSSNANSASISWKAPLTGGSRITGYQIQYSTNNGDTWLQAGTSATTSFTLKNLTPKTAYQVKVLAMNILGTSEASQELSSTTK